jgi:hypothetical protein
MYGICFNQGKPGVVMLHWRERTKSSPPTDCHEIRASVAA